NGFAKLGSTVSSFFGQIGSRKNELSNLFVDFTQSANTAVSGALSNLLRLTDWFSSELPTLGPIVKQIMSGAGSAIQGFGSAAAKMVSGVVADWPQIMSVWHQLGAAVKTLDLGSAAGKVGTFFSHLGQLDPVIKGVVQGIQGLEAAFRAIAPAVQGAVSLIQSIGTHLGGTKDAVRDLAIGLVALKASAVVFSAIAKGAAVFQALSKAIIAVKDSALLAKAAEIAAAAATKIWAAAQFALDAVMDANPIALLIIGIAALIAIIVLVVTHWKQTQEVLNAVWGLMKSVAAWIAGAFVAAWDAVIAAVGRFLSAVRSDFSAVVGAITSALGNALGAMGSWIGNMISRAGSGIHQVVSAIVSAFSGLAGQVEQIGASVIQGLASGITGAISAAVGAAKSAASAVMGAIKSVINPGSPSKVTTLWGRSIMDGLAVGMQAAVGGTRSVAASTTTSVLNAVRGSASANVSVGGQQQSLAEQNSQIISLLQRLVAQQAAGNTNTAATAAATGKLAGKPAVGAQAAQRRAAGPS
ncbi:MAG TPA: hypothetical protein VHX64_06115, partial [Caulobacteraceae bacterium]|nr:hypothetical protein [Caulobacteraceae bacterium]